MKRTETKFTRIVYTVSREEVIKALIEELKNDY